MDVELVERKPLLTPSRRGMGHREGPLPAGMLSTRHLFGARRTALASGADLSGYVEAIRDQGQTSRCVGMAFARVCHVLAQVEKFGRPNPSAIPYPSEIGIYALAREEEGSQALADEGSIPGLALQALLSDVGIPLDRDWPADDANINRRLPADVLARAIALKMTDAYEIDSSGPQRSDECAQALIANHPFTMAIQVGDSYENATDDPNYVVMPVLPGQKVYGGHDISILGFRTFRGRRQWLNGGSWGPNFGRGGFVWLDDSVITASSSSDFIVPKVVPDFAPASPKEIA